MESLKLTYHHRLHDAFIDYGLLMYIQSW